MTLLQHQNSMNGDVQSGIRLDAVTRDFLDAEFQRRFFEAAVVADPRNIECLLQLGDIYSRQGDHENGLRVDRQLTELCPEEPTFHYNLACSYSVLGHCTESADALRAALELGYDDFDYIQRDDDLKNLRQTEDFDRLLELF